jgi:hypothetical protein
LINENIPRWIRASISKYFNDTLKGKLPVFVEGMDLRPGGTEFCEVRLDGPTFKQYGSKWKVSIHLSVLIQMIFDDSDIYKIDRETGKVVAAFPTTLSIFRLGNGPDDSNEYLDCLSVISEGGEDIVVIPYGKIAASTNLMQTTVGAHYYMWLQDEKKGN